jgi:hypothetical protein
MRSNAGTANSQGDGDLFFAQVTAPSQNFGLAWLGLAWLGLAWLGLAWLGLAWLGAEYQFNASYNKITYRGETTDQTHQEGRSYARLPGHDASWTGHYTASQQSTPSQHAHTSSESSLTIRRSNCR